MRRIKIERAVEIPQAAMWLAKRQQLKPAFGTCFGAIPPAIPFRDHCHPQRRLQSDLFLVVALIVFSLAPDLQRAHHWLNARTL
ncbi:hypothetical protein FOCG_18343 [Fusarium oxysporum f. sp. radicis-lycopersici 26381]|nr:hypothetical protein FOWG_16967 [Fusarium oxysporum f. sp. lycopersici MN25]EXL39033.1 hypothetical protein FOCG_18343 [Fusarium oxysporum f. sp. radicis-lycopersici 26381]